LAVRAQAAVAALFLTTLSTPAAGQVPAPGPDDRTAAVTTIAADIVVDGALDEPAWQSAPTIGDLVQRQPDTGAAPSQRTDVRILRDADNLYIGVVAWDTEPGRIIATQLTRDAGLGSDDRIEIVLDTFRDQRNAFYFATNAAGAFVDGLAFANGTLNSEWDAIWDVRTQRTADGWVAEFAIPFKSLGFPAGESIWGFNVSRTIYRRLEEDRWSGARLETQFLQVSEAGELTNLGGLTQGIGLDIRPFMAGTSRYTDASDRTVLTGRPGLDLAFNFTPSLKLTATVNTDFGETEVDARQINLGRFSLLFPEKRAFFLEDAGVFTFASNGPPPAGGIPNTGAEVFPFFSRRIGLLNGTEVPLDAGVKVTGRAGRTDIGLLDVRIGDTTAAEAGNAFVGRLRQNFLEQSYVGVIVTDGDPASPAAGRTAGVDLSLATSRLFGASRNLIVNAYGLRSDNAGVTGNDWSYGVSAYYPNDRYSAQVILREIQANFDPALGFVQRRNVRLLRVAGSFNPRPRDFLNVQQMFHDVYYTRFTRLDTGELESEDLYATLLDWHLNTGDNFHGMLDFNIVRERLFEPFAISPGVVLPVGEYRFTRFKSNLFTTAATRPVSGGLTVWWGNFWSGTAVQGSANVAFRLPPRFTLGLSTNQTWAELPEGHFTARIFSGNVEYTPSPFVSFSSLVQYDNRSRNLGWQSRVRWTVRPGDDLFFVVNQGWIRDEADDGRLRFTAQDRRVSAKVQYVFRL
jgi:hypothetical protein